MRSSSTTSFSSSLHPSAASSVSLSPLRKTTSGLGTNTTRKTRGGGSWFGRSSALATTTSSRSLEDSGPGYGDDPDGHAQKEEVLGLDMTLGTLGKTRMVFTDRGWQVDDAVVRKYEEKLQQLTEQLSEVRWEQQVARASETEAEQRHRAAQQIEAASAATAEEVATLQFKNQLLIEMLAIAQLDESHALQSCEREEVKAEEYRRELERCYARMLHHGLDPGTSTTTTSTSSSTTMKSERKSMQARRSKGERK